MAGHYVRSGATGSNNGSSWANAFTTLEAAFAAGGAGDVFYVAHDHQENKAASGNWILTSPGTVSDPCYVLSCDDTAEPPTALLTGAVIDLKTGNYTFTITGSAYYYGITFATTPNSSSCDMYLGNSTQFAMIFDRCNLALNGGNSGSFFFLVAAAATTNIDDHCIKLKNCMFTFSHASQYILPVGCRMDWLNGSVDSSGTAPITLFVLPTANASQITIEGVDLSKVTGTLFDVDAASVPCTNIRLANCKLGDNVTIANTITGQGGAQILMDNCDSGDTNYRMEHYKYQGSIKTETTIVKASGASDGTTPHSWKMASLATGPTFAFPLESPWIAQWNDSTGSSKTATIEIVHDSATDLTDGDVWIEVEYLGTSGSPIASLADDRKAGYLTAAADQAASSATWTTTGLTNPNTQAISVSFTPQEKGFIKARVMLAKANYTIYVDPLITVS
jgi:hypothetical protein